MIHVGTPTGDWCGPSAISLLTGIPYPRTVSTLAFVRDEPYNEVTGVYTEEAVLALYNLGYTATPVDLASRYERCPTLQRYMRERPVEEKTTLALVSIYKHFMVAHFDYLADSWIPKPTHFSEFPKPQRLVEQVHLIRRRRDDG